MDKPFTNFAKKVSDLISSPVSFVIVLLFLISFALFSERVGLTSDWEETIKLISALVSIATLFLLKYIQNRDTKAILIKLDELLRTKSEARNELINLENCSDEELDRLEEEFKKLKKKKVPV